MILHTPEAILDIERVRTFLEIRNPQAAVRAMRAISLKHDEFRSGHQLRAQRAPSPRRGEGWGEGVRKFEKILHHPNPLTLARCARSTSPLRGEVKQGPDEFEST